MATIILILLVLSFVLALLAIGPWVAARFNLLSAAFAAFVLAVLLEHIP